MRTAFLAPAAAVAWLLAGCISQPFKPAQPAIDPDAARADIQQRIPATVRNADGWAVDLFAALDALQVAPTPGHTCAVLAVVEQESGYQVDPVVTGLPAIARREITARAAKFAIPAFVVDAALELKSPDGRSYRQRLDHVRTEKDLSDLYEDFIGSVPLGKRLFEDFNPVRTAGPMQVNIAYAEQQVKQRRYPYAMRGSLRDELFSRRGGLYFGAAHLLDYDAGHEDMLFRFADFNAGQYASRNAAFQAAVATLAHTPLVPDGDLFRRGAANDAPGQTEQALRTIGARLRLSDADIRRDLQMEKSAAFTDTALYRQVMSSADAASGRAVPRAMIPRIRLEGPKISRRLTTDWYAHRVDGRYRQCLQRGGAPPA